MQFLSDSKKDELYENLFDQLSSRYSEVEVSRYYDDPVRFAVEVLKYAPTDDQKEILRGLRDHGHVTVRSGHGVGKSRALATAAHWFIRTRPHSIIPVTAPSASQLFSVFWNELIRLHRQMEPSYRDQFEFTSEKYFHREFKESWFIAPRTARPEKPEALQGFHSKHLLFLVDESPGVLDQIFEVALSALTDKNNWVLMAGNPTRLSGFFYDSWHSDRANWHCLHFSSLDSPLVDPSFPERMAQKYGESSNIFKVRVLGEFPTSEEDQLIPLHIVEAAVNRDIPEDGSVVWGLDVARFGSDETCLVKRRGDVVKEIKSVRGYDIMEVAGWIANEILNSSPEDRPTSIFIDSIGYGAGCADRLRELGHPAIDVNVAEKPSTKEKFINLRAELWCEFRDSLYAGSLSLPDDPGLLAQASSIKYSFHSSGKLRIERKEDLKKRGLPSPDRADAVILTFYKDRGLWAGCDLS